MGVEERGDLDLEIHLLKRLGDCHDHLEPVALLGRTSGTTAAVQGLRDVVFLDSFARQNMAQLIITHFKRLRA